MKRVSRSCLYLATIILAGLFISGNHLPPQQTQTMRQERGSEIEADPPLIIRGRTSTIYFVAGSLPAVKAVKIIPPVGVRVVEIKSIETRPDGRRALPVVFETDAETWGGLRVAYLETEAGPYRVDIRIGTHPIVISELKFSMASPAAEQAEVVFRFSDEAGDIRPNDELTKVQIMLMCDLWGRSASLSPAKIVMTDERQGTVSLTLPKDQLQSEEVSVTELREQGVRPAEKQAKLKPQRVQAGCQLFVTLKDRDGNESNQLRTVVRFK